MMHYQTIISNFNRSITEVLDFSTIVDNQINQTAELSSIEQHLKLWVEVSNSDSIIKMAAIRSAAG